VAPVCKGTIRPKAFQLRHDPTHLLVSKNANGTTTNVAAEPLGENILRHWRLEGAVPDEEDDRVQNLGVQIQMLGQTSRVPGVLMQWILKGILPAEDALRPLWLIRRPEDPTAHVLRLNHEDSGPSDHEMVNLRCAVRGRDDDVVESHIGLIESNPQS
jgi:hypothetical protein